jgi:hypothetical protein
VQTVLQPSENGHEMRGRPAVESSRAHQLLRYAAVAFIVAVAIHGGDHEHRGIADQSSQVVVAGTIQAVLGALTVVLVFREHRWAPIAAVVVGFASALLFSAAHLVPTWGFLSDSYVTPAAGAGVTWFSWLTAVLEIGADLVFGWAGLNVLRERRSALEPA